LENLEGRDQLENLGIDRRMMLKWIIGKWNRDRIWIYVAQDRAQWQAFCEHSNEVLHKTEISKQAEQLLTFQERSYTI
jgi:hypothetical protein